MWLLIAPYKNQYIFIGKDRKLSITQAFKIILGWKHKLKIQQLCCQNLHIRQLSAEFPHNTTVRVHFAEIPLYSTAVAEEYQSGLQKNI